MINNVKEFIKNAKFGFISILMGGLFYLSPSFTLVIPNPDYWTIFIVSTWITNALGFSFVILGKRRDRIKILWILGLLFHVFIGLFSLAFIILMIAGILD
ncbi:MAG TPA: hypothetical protein VEV44_14360 [Pseudoneobacillus sp.]|nr:hypothetical protein [Pseudoneobacillus sp.]